TLSVHAQNHPLAPGPYYVQANITANTGNDEIGYLSDNGGSSVTFSLTSQPDISLTWTLRFEGEGYIFQNIGSGNWLYTNNNNTVSGNTRERTIWVVDQVGSSEFTIGLGNSPGQLTIDSSDDVPVVKIVSSDTT
ncbi:hypothetical protein FBU30_000743, partial [Linnemannia zychae]